MMAQTTSSPKQTATKYLAEMINNSEMSTCSREGKGEATAPQHLSTKYLLYSGLHSARASTGDPDADNYHVNDKDDNMETIMAANNNAPPSPRSPTKPLMSRRNNGGGTSHVKRVANRIVSSQQNIENSFPAITNIIRRQSSQNNKPPLLKILPTPMTTSWNLPPSSPAPTRNSQSSPASRKVLEEKEPTMSPKLKAPSPQSRQHQQPQRYPSPSRTCPRILLASPVQLQQRQQASLSAAGKNKSRKYVFHKQEQKQQIFHLQSARKRLRANEKKKKQEELVAPTRTSIENPRGLGGFGDRYLAAINRVNRQKGNNYDWYSNQQESSSFIGELIGNAATVSNDDTPLIHNWNCKPDTPITNDQVNEFNSLLDGRFDEDENGDDEVCDMHQSGGILCGSRSKRSVVEPAPPTSMRKEDSRILSSPQTNVPLQNSNTPNESESLLHTTVDLKSMPMPDTKVNNNVKRISWDKDIMEGTKAPSLARGTTANRSNLLSGAYIPWGVMVHPSYDVSELASSTADEFPSTIAKPLEADDDDKRYYWGRAQDERIPHSPLIVAGSLEPSGQWASPEIIAATESAGNVKRGDSDDNYNNDTYQEGPSFDETSPDASKSYISPQNIGWGVYFRDTEPTPSPTKLEVPHQEELSACGTDSEASKATVCCQRLCWRRLTIGALVLLVVLVTTVYYIIATSSSKSSSSDRSTPFIGQPEQGQGTPPPTLFPVPDPADTDPPTSPESPTLSPPVDTTYSPTSVVPTGSPTRQSTQAENDTSSPVSSSLPSSEPSSNPTASPSLRPSASPSFETPVVPTVSPTRESTQAENDTSYPVSSSLPSSEPSSNPTVSRSLRPSASPSFEPSEPAWDMTVLDEGAWTGIKLDFSYEWPHDDNILELEIQSSLESKWQGFFDDSIGDWNASEALVLTSNQSAYESTCRPEIGKLKICNADYGTTDWRGITLVFLHGNQIIASTIKLNDFYSATAAWNQYNVCHQLGHALGLGHSEGNNCMAIVTSQYPPEHPDLSNLDELVELYTQETRQRDLEFGHRLRGRSPKGAKEHRVEVHKV